ncbi:MAG TPA: UDP-3-O-acyl-N-acetylglucosamine deacetylase [Coxiellaceae bacterium]|nr:UDP-3-O-acyl-N-acetylglucosamine deacetylase [Coxiellaceae bacterium]
MTQQQTLQHSATITGIGVHSGDTVTLTLHSAPENTGIVFRRMDLNPIVEIPAHIDYLGNTDLCTCLKKGNVQIATIEHLLSAFSGLGIDNGYVDLTSTELPIMDGSAKPFVDLIQKTGIKKQNLKRNYFRVQKMIEVREGDQLVRLEPYDGFQIHFSIDFKHPVIANTQQSICMDVTLENYIEKIAHARTFGFLSDYEAMRAKNCARGANLENTIVIDDNKVMNNEGLRTPNEFIQHKVLDVIGDLYLLGRPLLAKFTGVKSGHALNSRLLKKLLAN